MREAIRDALATDPTLQALLTGGVYAVREITRQATPDAFDANGEVLPCALVARESDTASGPYAEAGALSSQMFVAIYFYQRSGHDIIDAAQERAAAVLHRQKLDDGVWEIVWSDDVTDQEDDGLGCSMGMSRYQVTKLRSW